MSMKSEIRSTKSETNPKHKEESTKRRGAASRFDHFPFSVFWICFGFRASHFRISLSSEVQRVLPPRQAAPHLLEHFAALLLLAGVVFLLLGVAALVAAGVFVRA
jgi:hypothetical protein